MRKLSVQLFIVLTLPFMATPGLCVQDHDIAVKAEKKEGILIVDAELTVAAGTKECWAVLTDFDNMAAFVRGMETSKVMKRSGNVLEVEQKGRAPYGFMSFAYESIRQITLTPYEEIRSHGIGGSVKQYDGVTRVIGEGDSTRIVYHAESVPGVAVPGMLLVPFVRAATQRQFDDMRAEILRRKAAASH
jgi:carbon monoxide dehydrogenase subunit G